MKKIFATILSLGLLLSAVSCSEDFITKEKPYSVTEEMVFSDPAFIEADLLGCYSAFKSSNPTFLGGVAFVVFDNRGDDIVNVSNPQTQQETYEMKVLPTSLENVNIWDYAYYTINTCNLFCDKLEAKNCKEILGEETYNQFIAEARFIRAYSYWVLCNLYSKPYCIDPDAKAVPLRLVGLESSGHNDCPLATISEIYNQILEDCQPDALPDASFTAEGTARASKGAAHLLRMRVYMAMEQWSDAIDEGEAIKGYKLADDVTSLYGTDDVYSSKEMIFALPSTSKDKPNTQMAATDYFCSKAEVAWIDTEGGIAAEAGYFLPADARVSELTEEVNGRSYSVKYMDYGASCDWVPLMRYAEVELNLAECYFNDNKTTDAVTHLKAVRSRSIAAADDMFDVSALSGNNLKTAIYNERRLEFLAEGMRGIDILRRGEKFSKHNSFVDIDVDSSASTYTWPIPAEEKTYNHALDPKNNKK